MNPILVYVIASVVAAVTLYGIGRVFSRRAAEEDEAAPDPQPDIRVLTRARIARGRTLVVVEVEGRRLLLGSTHNEWTALADLGTASGKRDEDPFAPFDTELTRAMHATRYRKGWRHS